MNRRDCWELVGQVLAYAPRVLLHGPPGTGKTRFASTAGLAPGTTVYSITLTEDTAAAELRGHFVPKGREGFVWHDGPMIRAWRESHDHPVRLVVNEIDHASEDVMSLLHSILDDGEVASFTLPTGETVRPGPGLGVVATMNGDPEDLSAAVLDRFPVCIQVNRVHPEALETLPEDLRDIAAHATVLDGERRVSLRVWAMFAHLRGFVPEDVAAQACFGDRAEDVLNSIRIGAAVGRRGPC